MSVEHVADAALRSNAQSYGFTCEEIAPNKWTFLIPPIWEAGDKLAVSVVFESEATALASFDAEFEALRDRREQLQGAYRELTQAGYRFERTANGVCVVTDAYDVGGEGPFPTEIAGLDSVAEFIGRENFKLRGWKMYAAHHGFKVSRVEDGWAICVDASVVGLELATKNGTDQSVKLFAQFDAVHGLPLSKPFKSEQAALQAVEGLRYSMVQRREALLEAHWLLLKARCQVERVPEGFVIAGPAYEDDVTFATETDALDGARAFVERKRKRIAEMAFERARISAPLTGTDLDNFVAQTDSGKCALESARAFLADQNARGQVFAGSPHAHALVICGTAPQPTRLACEGLFI